MAREQNVSVANSPGLHCELFPARQKSQAASMVWPDGGVVTQRTANPLPAPGNPHKFARFTACSSRHFPRERASDCELSKPALAPVTGRAALRWIAEHHRHLPKLQGALFAVGVEDRGQLVGVGTAGNPPRVWQGTGRFIISRVATLPGDGPGDHAAPYCTMIYGALCRAGKALGYQEAWTYTLPHEPGISLRAAGFFAMGLADGGEHDRPSRKRAAVICALPKRRWMRPLTREALAKAVGGAVAEIARLCAKLSPTIPATIERRV